MLETHSEKCPADSLDFACSTKRFQDGKGRIGEGHRMILKLERNHRIEMHGRGCFFPGRVCMTDSCSTQPLNFGEHHNTSFNYFYSFSSEFSKT